MAYYMQVQFSPRSKSLQDRHREQGDYQGLRQLSVR
jgi:hypothetical protein